MLRKEAPVFRVDLPGSPVPVFLVTRRRELEFVTQHTELFTNQPPRGMWRWPELHEPAVAEAFAAAVTINPANAEARKAGRDKSP